MSPYLWCRRVMSLLLAVTVCAGVGALEASAQSAGKLSGVVTDSRTGETLVGVNVVLDETTQGAATDSDGYYDIVGIRPGTYAVVFRYIGYREVRVEDVRIEPNKTTELDMRMQEAVIEGEEVVVYAEQPIVQKDRTTTTANVSSEQLEALPVTNISDAINLQAGIVDGHFRGGRISEVAYLINGVPINNVFTQQASFQVEQNMIENLEVISGVFNAEYGQALSGVVNITTKDVPRGWTGNGQAYAGALASTRKMEFLERTAPAGDGIPVEEFEWRDYSYVDAAPFPSQLDAQFSIGGPIIPEKLGFRVSGRVLNDDGHLIARRLFMPADSSQRLTSGNPDEYLFESTGDQEFVARGGGRRYTVNASSVFRPTGSLRFDYNIFFQSGEGRPYQHTRKYAPEGTNTNYNLNQTHIVGLRYAVSEKSYLNASYSYLRDDYESRLHGSLEGPYVSPRLGSLAGTNAFQVGGNDLYWTNNLTETHTAQVDYTIQANRVHLVKGGVSARFHNLDNRSYGIEVAERTNFEARVTEDPLDDNTLQTQPWEFAAYLQDKMEFENLIVNAGLRFDYFQPDYLIPLDWAQAQFEYVPASSDPMETDSLYNRRPADVKYQVSPRLGIAFPISATGVLRFSAGLFFQIPPFNMLYSNPEFEAMLGGSDAFFGNPNLDPERTLTFELGLQQGITDALGLEVTVFSKDIRNLTGQEILRTPQGNLAVRSINTDVGTVRGITFSAFQRPVGPLSWTLDYTLQFAEGTASDPGETFARFQSGEEEIISLVRLNWDRRHVLNNTITIEPSRGLQLTLINRLETGTPYTTVRNDTQSLLKNDDTKPAYFLSDIRALYSPPFVPDNLALFFQVQNLFDEPVQHQVYAETGLATESLQMERFRRSNTAIGGANSLDDYFYNPTYLGAPRRVNVGLRFNF